MDKSILLTISLEEFTGLIRQIVSEELQKKEQQLLAEKLLSVKEACRLFQPAISPQTLHTWTKSGLIPMQKIGGKNYYKYSEILKSAKTLKRYKHHVQG